MTQYYRLNDRGKLLNLFNISLGIHYKTNFYFYLKIKLKLLGYKCLVMEKKNLTILNHEELRWCLMVDAYYSLFLIVGIIILLLLHKRS